MYHITHTMGAATGLEEDAITNTFNFVAPQPLNDADLTDLIVAVRDFYNVAPTGQSYALKDSLSLHLSRAGDAGVTKAYFLTGRMLEGAKKNDPPTHAGSPVKELPFTLAGRAGGEATLPSEVAMAVTLEGLNRETSPVEGPGDTRPRARRTGRIFLGPFTVSALTSETAARIPQALIDRALAAVNDLHDASEAIGTPLGVWSRADADAYEVTHASIDNAFDTQRRRGLGATARTRIVI